MFSDIFFCDHLNGMECFDFDGTGDGYGYGRRGGWDGNRHPLIVEDRCFVSGSHPGPVYLSGGRTIPEGWYPSDLVCTGKKMRRSARYEVEVPEWIVRAKRKNGAKRKEFSTID